MWVMKWAVGSLILGRNLFGEAINEVFVRSGAGVMDVSARLDAVYNNWRHYEYSVYAVLLTGWLVWVIVRALVKGWHTSRDSYAYLLVGCSGVVWYMVLANHTMEHHFFTYRIFNVSVTAFLLLLAGSVLPGRDDGEVYIRGKKGRRATVIGGIMLLMTAGGCSLLAREELPAANTWCPSEGKLLEAGETLEFDFIPTFSGIRNICVCLEAAEGGGALEITVLRQEEILYREVADLEKFQESGYSNVPVKWNLRAGESYTVRYAVTGNDGPVRLAVTEPGNAPLIEIGQVTLNGEEVDGQPVVILAYRHRPVIKKRLVFLTLSWAGVLAGTAVAVCTAFSEPGRRRAKKARRAA